MNIYKLKKKTRCPCAVLAAARPAFIDAAFTDAVNISFQIFLDRGQFSPATSVYKCGYKVKHQSILALLDIDNMKVDQC